MAREKKPVHKVVMTEGKRDIIKQLLQEYDIQTAEDIQDALKDLLGGTIKEMMEAEMDDHLGYGKSERSDSDDYRNGYKSKRINSSYGSMEIQVPQDRRSTFEPQVVKKRQKDIYGFEASEGFISDAGFVVYCCYYNSLDLAEGNGIHSIAFPTISTGAYRYSLKDAACVAMKAISGWMTDNKDYEMVGIICCCDRKTYDAYDEFIEFCRNREK